MAIIIISGGANSRGTITHTAPEVRVACASTSVKDVDCNMQDSNIAAYVTISEHVCGLAHVALLSAAAGMDASWRLQQQCLQWRAFAA